MADAAPITFDRKPYTVSYMKDGKKQTIRRVPPPKLHDALPTDEVELTFKKNDDFPAGKTYEVKSISPRQPNVLQIQKSDGETTFVPYYDVKLTRKVAERDGVSAADIPENNKYLLWP